MSFGRPSPIVLKSAREIERMRAAGQVVAEILSAVAQVIRPGVSTAELGRLAEEIMTRAGARSASKGYPNHDPRRPPFPGSICTSVNEQVVHGIPGQRRLREGDIVAVDVALELGGYFADAARTFPVGEVSPLARRLLQVTERALEAAIAECRPGRRTGQVGHAVQAMVEAAGFSVVREYTGHGIGQAMHEPPELRNWGSADEGPPLEPGMTLAVEPMVNAGGWETKVLADGWTVVTRDRSLSAHFEDTVAVTADLPQVLTRPSPARGPQPDTAALAPP